MIGNRPTHTSVNKSMFNGRFKQTQLKPGVFFCSSKFFTLKSGNCDKQLYYEKRLNNKLFIKLQKTKIRNCADADELALCRFCDPFIHHQHPYVLHNVKSRPSHGNTTIT